jgi:hypothetical protein
MLSKRREWSDKASNLSIVGLGPQSLHCVIGEHRNAIVIVDLEVAAARRTGVLRSFLGLAASP